MYVSLVFGWMTWLLGPSLDIPLVVPGTDMDTVSCVSSVMDLGGDGSLDLYGAALLGIALAGMLTLLPDGSMFF